MKTLSRFVVGEIGPYLSGAARLRACSHGGSHSLFSRPALANLSPTFLASAIHAAARTGCLQPWWVEHLLLIRSVTPLPPIVVEQQVSIKRTYNDVADNVGVNHNLHSQSAQSTSVHIECLREPNPSSSTNRRSLSQYKEKRSHARDTGTGVNENKRKEDGLSLRRSGRGRVTEILISSTHYQSLPV
ncbi:hypothetical protein Tco_0958836 [Tanacetum coccineum]